MSATREQARWVFEQWHERISQRDGAALAALYADDAVLESPLVPRVLDAGVGGVVTGRAELDHFLAVATASRSEQEELPSLHRTGTFLFDGQTLVWEYPRQTPQGDQLDLVEVMDLDGDRITRHRIYWGWRGTEHLLAHAVARASSTARS